MPDRPVTVRRAGGPWEFAGFLTILLGLALFFVDGTLALAVLLAGFVVFLVGRFQ